MTDPFHPITGTSGVVHSKDDKIGRAGEFPIKTPVGRDGVNDGGKLDGRTDIGAGPIGPGVSRKTP